MATQGTFAHPGLINEIKRNGFKLFERESNPKGYPTFSRRDFYKIVVFSGRVRINYADHFLDLDGLYLFFASPAVAYSTEVLSDNQSGYHCYFTEDFFKAHDRTDSLQHFPVFKINGSPAFKLTEEQYNAICNLFKKMQAEECSTYIYKNDLIRNYIHLIIHEALKMHTAGSTIRHNHALYRVASLFQELLEKQFPIESPKSPLQLKSALNYADKLSIHTNYLNRAVKEVIGKPTTVCIAERVTIEALALLQYSDWSVADIAYGLGFESSNYFNHFFKKMTGQIPKKYRRKI